MYSSFSFSAASILEFSFGFSSCECGPPLDSESDWDLDSEDSGCGSDFVVTRFFLMKFLVSSAILLDVSLPDFTRFNTLEIRVSIDDFSSLFSSSTVLETDSDWDCFTNSDFFDKNFS